MVLMLASITLDRGDSLPPSAARGLDVSWQGETARHGGLVSGGQEVGRSWQGGKGSRPLGIGGRLG